jgi:hypothetical protein
LLLKLGISWGCAGEPGASHGSGVSGFTDVNVVLDSGFEKRVLSISLDRSLVETSQVFNFSLATVSVIIVVSLLVLIILLSSRRLSVEEALEFKNGVASILVGEANVLPRLGNAVDHAVLVSDQSVVLLGGRSWF